MADLGSAGTKKRKKSLPLTITSQGKTSTEHRIPALASYKLQSTLPSHSGFFCILDGDYKALHYSVHWSDLNEFLDSNLIKMRFGI